MKEKFKNLSLFEFQEQFPNDDKCKEYLAAAKWSNGYRCLKCGHKNYCKGHDVYSRQCTKCSYIESSTAGTLFHLCRFKLLKAFYLFYYILTSKEGISSTELSRKLELRQKTCWLFKQRVVKALEDSRNFTMRDKVKVDEAYVGRQVEEVLAYSNGRKNLGVTGVKKG